MLSSLNSYGGLSAANVLMLFGTNSSSSTSSSTSTRTAQSASPGVSASDASDPATTIKAILAQSQIGTSGGGSTISIAEAAYTAQADGSSSLISASVTVSSPSADQQIADAVLQVNNTQIYTQTDVDPATHNGVSSYSNPITVTANDAVNVTLGGDGAVSLTTAQGVALPSGLPSLASIQQAYGALKSEDQGSNWEGAFDGNFTLVKLPSNETGSIGGPIVAFGTDDSKWALVLPQNSVSVAVSDTQVNG